MRKRICNAYLSIHILSNWFQLCSRGRSLNAHELAIAKVVCRPDKEFAQVILADGANGVQVCR